MIRRTGIFLTIMCLFWASPLLKGQGHGAEHAAVIVPDSSIEHPGDHGARAHTNHLVRAPQSHEKGKPGGGGGPTGETPQTIRPVYNLPSTGGSGIIAIVDAYHYPTAASDFAAFSQQFGLPNAAGQFTVIYASGSQPNGNCGWNQEAALDIEWAHAMAPSAQIVLVEADSNSFADLFSAVDAATNYITTHGGKGEVSMSWGGGEFSSEAVNDGYFNHPGIVYFASSGDTGGKNIYPGVSPNVVSAGGTSINRNGSGGFLSETAWSGSGGGPSAYEPRPSYQDGIVSIVGTKRGAPDFSFDANPNTGVSVFDSTSCQGLSGWMVFGGTSVAAPSLAGIVNVSNHFSSSSASELSTIYTNLGTSNFRDITSGSAGSFSAGSGWDFVTGVGSNQGTAGK